MINGNTVDNDLSVEAAKQKLIAAALRFQMDSSALASVWVNGILASARIDAIQQFLVGEDQDAQGRFAAILAANMSVKADQINEAVSKPRIHVGGSANGALNG
jgi:hypothetical protein